MAKHDPWTTLDPEAPLVSLRDVAGLTQADVARARVIARSSQKKAEDRGASIQLDTFLEVARKLGYKVELRVSKGE